MTMVKISDCFHYIINLLCYVMKSAGRILKLDRCLEVCRSCSAICKLAGQSTNWQIGLTNLQIGQIGRLDGADTNYSSLGKYSAENYFTRRLIDCRNQEYSADLDFFAGILLLPITL